MNMIIIFVLLAFKYKQFRDFDKTSQVVGNRTVTSFQLFNSALHYK